MTIDELNAGLKSGQLEKDTRVKFEIEANRRWAIALACLIFSILGVGLGATTNRRIARSSGMVLSILVIVGYWAIYVFAEGLAQSHRLPPMPAVWSVDLIFAGLGYWSIKRAMV